MRNNNRMKKCAVIKKRSGAGGGEEHETGRKGTWRGAADHAGAGHGDRGLVFPRVLGRDPCGGSRGDHPVFRGRGDGLFHSGRPVRDDGGGPGNGFLPYVCRPGIRAGDRLRRGLGLLDLDGACHVQRGRGGVDSGAALDAGRFHRPARQPHHHRDHAFKPPRGAAAEQAGVRPRGGQAVRGALLHSGCRLACGRPHRARRDGRARRDREGTFSPGRRQRNRREHAGRDVHLRGV